MRTRGTPVSDLSFLVSSSTLSGVMPFSNAFCDVIWMTLPSATGSVNGTPISSTSAPPSTLAFANSMNSSSEGYPAVK